MVSDECNGMIDFREARKLVASRSERRFEVTLMGSIIALSEGSIIMVPCPCDNMHTALATSSAAKKAARRVSMIAQRWSKAIEVRAQARS